MTELVVLWVLCILLGLGSWGAALWLAVTGQMLTMDGLALALIAFTVGTFLLFNVGWALHKGEIQQVWSAFRAQSASLKQPMAGLAQHPSPVMAEAKASRSPTTSSPTARGRSTHAVL
jgi:hypothetical protein